MELLILLVVVLVLSPMLIGLWKVFKGVGSRSSDDALTKDRRRNPDRRRHDRAVPADRREGPRREHEVAEDFLENLSAGSRRPRR